MFNNYIIASLHGIGDLCLVAGLLPAFKIRYCRNGEGVKLLCKRSHGDIAEQFVGPSDVELMNDADGQALLEYEARAAHRTTFGPQLNRRFVAHPSFVYVRPDFCVAKGNMTDVAMYALILGLDPHAHVHAPIVERATYSEAQEHLGQRVKRPGKTVVMFTQASSWPVPLHAGWVATLQGQLEEQGWDVIHNNDDTPLKWVVPLVERAGWAVGINSGIMQYIVQARAACRKTIVTPSLQGVSYPLPVQSALPYRSMRTVLGAQYDIEEFELDATNAFDITRSISHGRNAKGRLPADLEQPVYDVPMAPGEVIDRITILQLKAERLPQAHMVYREITMLWAIRVRIVEQAVRVNNVDRLYRAQEALYQLNREAWDDNQFLFDAYAADADLGVKPQHPDDLDVGDSCLAAFRRAGIDANHERVRIKNQINVLVGSFDREEKSYAT